MHFKTTLISTLFLLPSLIHACGSLPRAAPSPDGTPAFPQLLPGDDIESSPQTQANFINHLCLNVRNLTNSISWYNRAFGLRTMFTMRVSEHFSITYMGRSHGGRNNTGYQTSAEMAREKNNIEGLIELLHIDAPSWNLPAGINTPNTFHHIGMIVPDPEATQKHLDDMGANVLKRYDDPFVLKGGFADATGLSEVPLEEVSQEERDFVETALGPTNDPLIFVADPDGNIIEVQAQVERVAFGQPQ